MRPVRPDAPGLCALSGPILAPVTGLVQQASLTCCCRACPVRPAVAPNGAGARSQVSTSINLSRHKLSRNRPRT